MNIRFNGGKMFVTHLSGHIDSYTAEQVASFRNRLSALIADLQAEVTELERTVSAIEASAVS